MTLYYDMLNRIILLILDIYPNSVKIFTKSYIFIQKLFQCIKE